MEIRTQRFTVIACGLLLLALIAIAAVREPSAALAQQATGNLQVDPQPDREDNSKSLRTRVVMVSVLKDGAVIKQKEVGISDVPLNFTLPVGVYDVHVEGDEVTTVTRRGVHVTTGDSTKVLPQMRSGQGVCECRYSK